MRNSSAFQRRGPRAAQVFIIPSLLQPPSITVGQREPFLRVPARTAFGLAAHQRTHLLGARGYGTCSGMDQSLSVGLSAIARGNDERNPQQLASLYGSMLVTN